MLGMSKLEAPVRHDKFGLFHRIVVIGPKPLNAPVYVLWPGRSGPTGKHDYQVGMLQCNI